VQEKKRASTDEEGLIGLRRKKKEEVYGALGEHVLATEKDKPPKRTGTAILS